MISCFAGSENIKFCSNCILSNCAALLILLIDSTGLVLVFIVLQLELHRCLNYQGSDMHGFLKTV